VKCLSYLLSRAVLPDTWKGEEGDVDQVRSPLAIFFFMLVGVRVESLVPAST